MRFYLFEAALQGYAQHPFFGVGLNNATAAMKAGRQALIAVGIPMPPTESADSFYLVTLTEVGPLGFALFFAFFGGAVLVAIRAMREVAPDLKPLLLGMPAGLASLSIQNIADDNLAGHSISATLWLFAALIIAIARHVQPKIDPLGGWACCARRKLTSASPSLREEGKTHRRPLELQLFRRAPSRASADHVASYPAAAK